MQCGGERETINLGANDGDDRDEMLAPQIERRKPLAEQSSHDTAALPIFYDVNHIRRI